MNIMIAFREKQMAIKVVLILFLVSISMLNAQTTGFLQNFDDGTMTGWKSDHERTFVLSIDSTSLKIDYTRTASSDPWDNFNLTLPNEIDVSNTPRVYVKAKANIPVVIGLKPVPVNPVNVITKSIVGDGKWKDLFFDITNTSNLTVSAVYGYLDGGSSEEKSGTVWFDEIRIGDSVLTLPTSFTNLEEAITSANALLNSTIEGFDEGEFPPGSKLDLQNTITELSSVLGSDVSQATVDSLTSYLYTVCSVYESKVKTIPMDIVDQFANKQTRYLYLNLEDQMGRSLLFGMHDATGYGVGWSGDDDRSDVKDVVGDYPAVYSEDLNHITRGSQTDRVRYRLTSAYNRGGVITMCWHQYDPDGRSFYAENVNNEKIVSQILPGGIRHSDYLIKLKRVGDFFKSLRGTNGESIPIIFRPYHEHTGGWFWWGVGHCTTEEFNQLWQFTKHYLHDSLNVHNLLWAISPSFQHVGYGDNYFNVYPGDDYVDIFGGDKYFHTDPIPSSELNDFKNILQNIVAHSLNKNKIPALTEVGNENLTISNWFNNVLLEQFKDDQLINTYSYAAVWRNESTSHHFAPYPGHPSVPDFIKFYNDPYTLFESDLPDMYSIPEEDLSAPIFTVYPVEKFTSPTTSVEIKIETNERAFLRWGYTDQDYDNMTHQFQYGERNFEHITYIDSEHDADESIFVRAVDIYGNKTEQSIQLTFTVDTLQQIIVWSDPRYPLDNWNYNSTSLGSGNEASNKINEVQTAYFVKDFELTSKPTGARTAIQFNGGFAVYINGIESNRVNLPVDQELTYFTEATASLKTTKSINFTPEIVNLLNEGTNRIAVEVHGGTSQSVEFFDAFVQTNSELPFSYGSEWFYYDSGDMPTEFTLGEITGIEIVDNLIPAQSKLYQNYPNPFNPSTKIKFDLDKASIVSLEVYDILGRKTATLLDDFRNPGSYEVIFNAGNYVSGVYTFILRTGKYKFVNKMMLLK